MYLIFLTPKLLEKFQRVHSTCSANYSGKDTLTVLPRNNLMYINVQAHFSCSGTGNKCESSLCCIVGIIYHKPVFNYAITVCIDLAYLFEFS